MRLTTQMRAEFETIRTRIDHIMHEVFPFTYGSRKVTNEAKELLDASIQKMTTYKVRLENLLCETDEKEQAYLLMIIHLMIPEFFINELVLRMNNLKFSDWFSIWKICYFHVNIC